MLGRTRSGLLDGAARAFAAEGLRATTMQSIARAAGVAKGTLYNHFRTKDEVARALLAAELDRLTGEAGARPPDAALALLADELAGSPVLRRLRATDPDVLLALLAVQPETWALLTARLAAVLGVDPEADADAVELPARWLVGVTLQPGRSAVRHRDAARLAAALGRPDEAPDEAPDAEDGSNGLSA
jgi:AcrR family transcriptional regulator